MRSILCLFLIVSFSSFSQRIGLDVSTRMSNVNFTLSYHHVVKSNFILSAGVFAGGVGVAFSDIDTNAFNQGNRLRSPYSTINNLYADSSNNFGLLAYESIGYSSGFHLAFGYVKTINEVHSVRFHLNSRIANTYSTVKAFYRSSEIYRTVRTNFTQSHWIASLGLEVFHGIRVGDRTALYYGLKLPYYFSLNKDVFAPVRTSDLFNSFKPELSFGLTFFVGKID